MEEYETLICVRGCHEYQRVWIQQWRENFAVKGPQNPMDPYAVVVKKDGITLGKKAHGKFRECSMLLIIDVKNFICLIFTVWLNHKTFYH